MTPRQRLFECSGLPPGDGIGLRGSDGELGLWRQIGSQAQHTQLFTLLTRMLPDESVFPLRVPDFQRGRVWTTEQAEAFVGYMLAGGRAPIFYIAEGALGGDEVVDTIVDGQQRLSALFRFAAGQVGAVLPDGRRFEWAQMDDRDRRGFLALSVPVVWIRSQVGKADVLRLYLKINRGGTPHTQAEIARVEQMLAELDH